MSIAWAQAVQGSAAAGNQMSVIMSYAPIVLIVGIFYMLVMRPQAAAATARGAMLKTLTKGQTIVLQAGFIGTVKSVNDKTGMLEVELLPSGTVLLVERTSVERIVTDATVLTSSVSQPKTESPTFKKKR